MSLRELQDAIGRLVSDRASLDAYADDPEAWLAKRGLAGMRDARVLRGVDVPSLHLFNEIHDRDRASFLEAVLPLTLARVGPGWATPYFATAPFADDDVRAECGRYVQHLADHVADEGTLALARYELARFLLLDEPPFTPTGRMARQDHASVSLAPGLAVVPAGAHLPTLVEDPLHDAAPHAGVALLRRDEDGVTSAWLEGPTGEALAILGAGDAAALRRLIEDDEGRAALMRLLAEGVLQ